MSVVVVNDTADLEKYVADWDDLARDAIEPNVFYESWMLLPALRVFAAGQKVLIVLIFVRDPNQDKGRPRLCGLFPLERRRTYKRLPVSVLSFWRHRHCFLGVPLIRTGCADKCFRALLDWVKADQHGAALLECRGITGDGPFWEQLLDFLEAEGKTAQITDCHARALLRRGKSAQHYLEANLSGDRRKKLRKAEKQLAQIGPLEYLELQNGDDLYAWLDDFLRLEQSGWKGREGTALNCQTADREFFMEVARAAFARGRLMMLALRCGGTAVASLCNFQAGPGSFAFKVAFEEKFARYSPGVLLEMENIRRLHDRPEPQWMDSCSAPGPSLVKSFWAERRVMQTTLIDTGRQGTAFFLALLPLMRWFRQKVIAVIGLFRRSRKNPNSTAASTSPPLAKD